MKWKTVCVVAVAGSVIGALAVAWLLVKGWTTPSADGRTEVRLAPSERDFVLSEMRQLLKSVHGVVTGLSDPDQDTGRNLAQQASRAAGMAMAADANPAIMLKLPLPLKQMGMSVHRDFDGLADGIAEGEGAGQVLRRLSSITARCTTCHELYRLSEGR